MIRTKCARPDLVEDDAVEIAAVDDRDVEQDIPAVLAQILVDGAGEVFAQRAAVGDENGLLFHGIHSVSVRPSGCG